jgi:uncharacterized RDD family membrane protein YckC
MSSSKIFLNDGGQVSGPFDPQEIKQRLDSGSLDPKMLAKPEGSTAWVLLSEMLGSQTPEPAQGPPMVAITPPTVLPARDAQGRPYAGFWIRLCAYLIDGLILYIPNQLILVSGFAAFFAIFGTNHSPTYLRIVEDVLKIILALPLVIYFAAMESSKLQATLGKLILGLKVTDLSGNRISFSRALGRELAKLVSAFILCIGFIVIAFTSRKQALHDFWARTLVVSARKR